MQISLRRRASVRNAILCATLLCGADPGHCGDDEIYSDDFESGHCGSWSSVGAVEACDGLDDDCDGAVDNGDPGGGFTCDTGLPGACSAGITFCIEGSIQCGGPEPTTELCNGFDDDCDGVVDDGVAGVGKACDTGMPGVCANGVTVCSGKKGYLCDGPEPSEELCNGFDDDCDGVADDGCAELGVS